MEKEGDISFCYCCLILILILLLFFFSPKEDLQACVMVLQENAAKLSIGNFLLFSSVCKVWKIDSTLIILPHSSSILFPDSSSLVPPSSPASHSRLFFSCSLCYSSSVGCWYRRLSSGSLQRRHGTGKDRAHERHIRCVEWCCILQHTHLPYETTQLVCSVSISLPVASIAHSLPHLLCLIAGSKTLQHLFIDIDVTASLSSSLLSAFFWRLFFLSLSSLSKLSTVSFLSPLARVSGSFSGIAREITLSCIHLADLTVLLNAAHATSPLLLLTSFSAGLRSEGKDCIANVKASLLSGAVKWCRMTFIFLILLLLVVWMSKTSAKREKLKSERKLLSKRRNVKGEGTKLRLILSIFSSHSQLPISMSWCRMASKW